MDPYNAVTRNDVADSIVAKAGGAQAGATQLTKHINRVVTVASSGDSVILPPGQVSLEVMVINAHVSNAINLYTQVGGSLNAGAANAAFSIAAGKFAVAVCTSTSPEKWHTLLSA